MKPIIESLFENASTFPQKPALIYGGTVLTYQEVANKVVGTAEYLQNLGIKKNDSVVLSADSTATFVYTYFACHLLSVVSIPIDPRCSIARLQYIIDKMQPVAVFTGRNYDLAGIYNGLLEEIPNKTPKNSSGNLLRRIVPEDIADVLFTSGTTGDAKGVILTHLNITTAANHINKFIGNSADDIEVMPLPLSHSFGLGRMRCQIVQGGTIILVPGFSSPALIFRALTEHSATGLASVPAGFAILLSLAGDRLTQFADHLKYIEIGSAPMPIEHKKQLMSYLPDTRICMHYGLTEASRSVFIDFHRDKQHLSSAGKPASGVEIMIADENGDTCKLGETGKIMVKGGHCTKGYWNDKELTDEAYSDGWFKTGDFGYQDDQGFLYLVGRESDLINVGGLKVAPAEIEELLGTHPAINECACVGIPDPRNIAGKAVKAFLVKSSEIKDLPTDKEIESLLRGRIEPYKIPICYEWINCIPKTESGKIKRNELT